MESGKWKGETEWHEIMVFRFDQQYYRELSNVYKMFLTTTCRPIVTVIPRKHALDLLDYLITQFERNYRSKARTELLIIVNC